MQESLRSRNVPVRTIFVHGVESKFYFFTVALKIEGLGSRN